MSLADELRALADFANLGEGAPEEARHEKEFTRIVKLCRKAAAKDGEYQLDIHESVLLDRKIAPITMTRLLNAKIRVEHEPAFYKWQDGKYCLSWNK